MSRAQDIRFLDEALRLAERGRGSTSPNPVVGALVVRDEHVVGRGYHACCGGPHAERMALEQAGDRARGATLYVTLEPCSIHGRTPPCTDAIIASGVSRVVAPVRDPNPCVNGSGFEILRQAGLDVEVGLLADEAERQNAGYFTYRRLGRPHVHLKLACSLDGRVYGHGSEARRISSPESLEAAHALRAGVDGVLVGIGTALADDPLLTDRRNGATRQPRRYVLDSECRLPLDSSMALSAAETAAVVLCAQDADPHRRAALEGRGVRPILIPRGERGLDLDAALRAVADDGSLDLLVEGGPSVATSLLAREAVDRITLFLCPRLLGNEGVPAFGTLSGGALSDGSAFRNAVWTRSGRDMRFDADIAREQGAE